MADPFVGQIMLVPYNFAPSGWAFCQGQLLPISQNTALFSLLGTFYGGNGVSTFALPNLQGTVPIGQGTGSGLSTYSVGDTGGVAAETLVSAEMPSHKHTQQGSSGGQTVFSPIGNNFGEAGRTGGHDWYVPPPTPSTTAMMNPAELQMTGGSQSHPNMQPYLVMNYVIALRGIYPARS